MSGTTSLTKILIRDETKADIGAIGAVTAAAFAEMEGRVVGHIAFSPVTLSDGTEGWYGLGPVSVLPELQRRGIGKALIREGLARLLVLGPRGCCLVGHPRYYRQLGFENVDGLGVEGVPPEAFYALAFEGPMSRGTVQFHEASQATGP